MGLLKFDFNLCTPATGLLPKGLGLVSCFERYHLLGLTHGRLKYSLSWNGQCTHPNKRAPAETLKPSHSSQSIEPEKPSPGHVNRLMPERVRCCARGRPRRKSSRKSGGNQGEDNGKKSRDDKGDQKDSSRSNRGGNSGRGNGGNEDDRGKKDDDNDEDNEDEEDDENNEEEEEEGDDDEMSKKSAVSCDLWSINEKNRDSDESVLEDMLRLVPSADLNCEPPDLPAKPGSLVNLHGVVVHETAGGLVILNVRWRNKVYSGAFIDIKKNRWPADRLDEEIPTNGAALALNGKDDSLARKLNSKKGKKSSDDLDVSGSSRKKGTFTGITGDVLKHSPSKSGKRIADQNAGENNEIDRSKKRSRVVERGVPASPSSPPFIECPEPNCDKRYKHVNGLKYHQAHAHQGKSDFRDEEDRTGVKRSLEEPSGDLNSQSFSVGSHRNDILKLECIKKEEEEDYSLDATPKKEAAGIEVKSEKEDFSDSCDTTSANGESVIVDVENTGVESERPRCTPSISIEHMSEDKDDKASDKSCESSDSGNRLKPDRITLVAGENMYGVLPLMPPYFPSYLQHSPTLGSLNPQTLNNSLSSALQTSREMEGRNDYTERSRSSPSHGKANTMTVEHLRDYEKGLAQYAFSNQLMSRGGKIFPRPAFVGEDIVVASDEENLALSPDALPGLHESIFTTPASSSIEGAWKDVAEKGGIKEPHSRSNSDPSAKRETITSRRLDPPLGYKQGQPQSMISSALFQQLSQERLSTQLSNSNTNSDLAAPADIQHALSKVDIRRHFSPMLLSYLKPSHNEGGSSYDEGENSDSKRDPHGGRADANERTLSDKSISGSGKSVSTATSTRGPQAMAADDMKSAQGGITGSQLQPNISIGRPISRPVQKPESITGGASSAIKYREESGTKSSAAQASSVKDKGVQKLKEFDDKPAGEPSLEGTAHALKDSLNNESVSLDSKSFSSTAEASTWTKVTSPISTSISKGASSQFTVATTSAEKSSVEAKTWVPLGINSVVGRSVDDSPSKASPLSSELKDRGKGLSKGLGTLATHSQSIFTPQGLSMEASKSSSPFSVMSSKSCGHPRTALPVPIAPAPMAKPLDVHRTQERQESDAISRDVPQMSRFTLTSDNRLVPSPAENRGRPRKIRVEKTQQIPIGTAHDVEVIARIEDRPKKQQQQQQAPPSTSNIMRASVIHSMTSSSTVHKPTFSTKEGTNAKDRAQSKPKPPLPERERPPSNASNKSPLTMDFKRRSSFDTHNIGSQEKRPRIDGMPDGKRSPDLDSERSKLKPLGGDQLQASHRIDDRPPSSHSLGRPSAGKDDSRGKFPVASSTPLPASISTEILKARTSLADSPYLSLPPQFATGRIPPGLPYPLFLNPAFPRDLMHEQMAGCLPPGLSDDPLKNAGSSAKERYERERPRSPGESTTHSSRDLPSPRDHGLPPHMSKQHPGLSGFGKSTPDPVRMTREAFRTVSRTREQSPIFLGGHGSASVDPGRGLRPSLEKALGAGLPDRPLFGSAAQYHAPLSPSLMSRLRPEGPPDITSRQGQARLHESLLESSRLRREYPDTNSHTSSVPVTSRPTYLPHSQSSGPSLYADSVMNRSTPFGLRSPNLILRRADGAMVSPLPFDGRSSEASQR